MNARIGFFSFNGNRQTARNAASAILQVVSDFIVVMIVYAMAFRHCTPTELGTWSFVLAWLSFSRISDITIAPTVVCFTAKQLAKSSFDEVGNTIIGGLQKVGLRVSLASSIVFLMLLIYCIFTIDTEDLNSITQLSLLAWLYVVLLALATCLSAGLDGIKRTDLKVGAAVGANLARLIITASLVGSFGIFALAIGLVFQAAILLVLSGIALIFSIPQIKNALFRWPCQWSEETMLFSKHYQNAGILQFLLEPSTKVIFPLFAGLDMLGYYDFASKLVQQVRAAVVAPSSILLAMFSSADSKAVTESVRLYTLSSRIGFLVASFTFSVTICCLPLLAYVLIGSLQHDFVLFGFILAISWGVNAFSSVAYYFLIANNQIGVVTRSNLTMATLNIIGGIAGGVMFGGIGCAFGISLAIACGSFLLILGANQKSGSGLSGIFDRTAIAVGIFSFFISGGLVTYVLQRPNTEASDLGLLITFTVIAVVSIAILHLIAVSTTRRKLFDVGKIFTTSPI